MAKKNKKQFVYKHNTTGKYLQMSYVGDGEVYLDLVKEINKDCILDQESMDNWPIEEIIQCGDEGADVDGVWIDFEPGDFTSQEIEVKITVK